MHLVQMVAGELSAAGITIDTAEKMLVTGRILQRGEHEFERLQQLIGVDVSQFRRECIRSLGSGAALTEFAIARLPLTPNERLAATSLGGLAILMVSMFDAALDGGAQVRIKFPRGSEPTALSNSQLIGAAVNLYFRRLGDLPRNRPELMQTVRNAVERMYEAEIRSTSAAGRNRSTWWRKNVLPLAVLGIPAWMLAPSFTAAAFHRHLIWLCRLGEFFGWVDDCVDYADDRASAHLNRVDFRLECMTEEQLTRSIVLQAQRILRDWGAIETQLRARSYFTVILWSWIENKAPESS